MMRRIRSHSWSLTGWTEKPLAPPQQRHVGQVRDRAEFLERDHPRERLDEPDVDAPPLGVGA